MANGTFRVHHILYQKSEGEYGNNPDDASGDPKTHHLQNSEVGIRNNPERLMATSHGDWYFIFRKLFWDSMNGDNFGLWITVVTTRAWIWCSGKKSEGKRLQTLQVQDFGCRIELVGQSESRRCEPSIQWTIKSASKRYWKYRWIFSMNM